ncbi:hypothetical protein BH23PLA1_BH23PLA1_01570 [soil metagenome]
MQPTPPRIGNVRRRPGLVSAAAVGLALVFGMVPADVTRAQPGSESFAKPPETPLELWDAVDYLVRVGKADEAAPYLRRFLASEPDDQTLLEIRDRYGAGSILRLDDFEATRPQAEPLLERLNDAVRRNSRQVDRLRRFSRMLMATPAEQSYAIGQLREAGPYAVPFLVEELDNPGLSRQDRAVLAGNISQLGPRALPALVAALDSPNPAVAGDIAYALGRLDDRRALPFLMARAVGDDVPAGVRVSARDAIRQLTRAPFESQSIPPIRLLADEARRYHLGEHRFPSSDVEVWLWDNGAPRPRTVTSDEARTILGLKFARRVLELDPTDRAGQVVFLGLLLENAVAQVGLESFPSLDPTGAFPTALSAGPAVLGDVLRQALASGKMDLAAAAAWALARIDDRDALTAQSPPPLVEALTAPDRRVQFVAAWALVELAPPTAFPGSSLVVPTLGRFLAPYSAPRAVIIDGNLGRANQTAALLRGLGYESDVATEGTEGFELAASRADVELITIEPTALQGNWDLLSTVTNLRADSRTAGLPIVLLGESQAIGWRFQYYERNFPRVEFLVAAPDPNLFRRQLGRVLGRMGVRPLSDDERRRYAGTAAELLARIADQPSSPYHASLARISPELTSALTSAEVGPVATAALGDTPTSEAQRGLADIVLDNARPLAYRLAAADRLARSLQRFDSLLTNEQEGRLAVAFDQATDPALQSALATVVGALRPSPGTIGRRLQAFEAPAIGPAPTTGGVETESESENPAMEEPFDLDRF